MNALAIDLGTTAAKVSVVSVTGAILGSGMQTVETVFGPDGAAEQDPELVWQAVFAASRQALHEAGSQAVRGIRVVCATSQWSSIIPVDNSGLPVGPMFVWMDRRGTRFTSALHRNDADGGVATLKHWTEIHGLYPSTSLGHILYLQNAMPTLHDRTCAYLEPTDYLNARFCGRIAATSCTAMPLSLSDNRVVGAASWSSDLIQRAGVDSSKLPRMMPSLSVLGPILTSVANDLGLSHDVLVVAGATDSVAAAIGTGALEPGQGTVVMGTTGVLTAHHPERVVAMSKFIATMPSALSDRYYVMAEAGLGGKVLELFLEGVVYPADSLAPALRPEDPYAFVSSAIEQIPPGCDGLLYLPWLIGSMAPKIDGHQRGAFLGMSMRTTRAHMLRAVLEGISLQMRWLIDEVEHTMGTSMPMVRFAGGGAQSDTWSQIMADVLGRSVEQVEGARHANALGAGLLGFLSLGEIAVPDLAALVPIRRRYEPSSTSTQLFDERLDIYRDLHTKLSEPVARLNVRL